MVSSLHFWQYSNHRLDCWAIGWIVGLYGRKILAFRVWPRMGGVHDPVFIVLEKSKEGKRGHVAVLPAIYLHCC